MDITTDLQLRGMSRRLDRLEGEIGETNKRLDELERVINDIGKMMDMMNKKIPSKTNTEQHKGWSVSEARLKRQ